MVPSNSEFSSLKSLAGVVDRLIGPDSGRDNGIVGPSIVRKEVGEDGATGLIGSNVTLTTSGDEPCSPSWQSSGMGSSGVLNILLTVNGCGLEGKRAKCCVLQGQSSWVSESVPDIRHAGVSCGKDGSRHSTK